MNRLSYLFIGLGLMVLSCNLEKIDDGENPGNTDFTFVKTLDLGAPYAHFSSPLYSEYSYFDDFNGNNIRITYFKPNPGKIQIFSFDTTGNALSGYPLSSNQFELSDSFNVSYYKNGEDLFVRTKRKNDSVVLYDSCGYSWGVRKGNLFGYIFKIGAENIISKTGQQFGPYFGNSVWDEVLTMLFTRNGKLILVDHTGNFNYNPALQREVYEESDILLTEYTKDLGFVQAKKIDLHKEDFSWDLLESNNNYVLQGWKKSASENCMEYDGYEYKYLNKSDLSFSHAQDPISAPGIYIQDLFGMQPFGIDEAFTKGTDGDLNVFNRLRINVYNTNSELLKPGYPIYVNPPAGYSNIFWGNLVKSGNTFHIISLIKINPNSTVGELCLLKVNESGQVLDTDIYGATQGVNPSLNGSLNLKKMGDGGFLIYSFAPETGKLTIIRVDKNGNL